MTAGQLISKQVSEYEVMSPWAHSEPGPLRGITPRLEEFAGKKIGLFSNGKRAAQLTLGAFENRLAEHAPTATTSWYTSTGFNTPEILTSGKDAFVVWVESVDAVVLSVAD